LIGAAWAGRGWAGLSGAPWRGKAGLVGAADLVVSGPGLVRPFWPPRTCAGSIGADDLALAGRRSLGELGL